jgi:trigger factor
MNISQEKVDELNAVVRIVFSPSDYQPKIDEQIKEYARKVQMPGFRPGKVPHGMVKKMYGKSILVDELNKLTSDTLFGFIRENKLDVLGNPLPKAENDSALDLENPGDIKLAFELGLAPSFNIDLSSNHSFNLYTMQADEKYISEIVEDYRMRLGEKTDADSFSEEKDSLHGHLTELNDDGSVKEGGFEKHVHFSFADFKAGNGAEVFTNMKAGDEKEINLNEAIVNQTVIAAILGVQKEELAALNNRFLFKAEGVERTMPAELNQDFFDKLLGPGTVTSLEELHARISEDASKRYRKDSENRLFNEAVEHLVANTQFSLPDEFLKRWLISQNEGKVNPGDIEQNYTNYSKGIRWQLIEQKLLRDNNINITSDQVLEAFTEDFLAYMGAPGTQDEFMRERAAEIAKSMMKNEQEVNKVYERLYNEALTTLFLSGFDVKTIELPFEQWVEQMNKPLN